MTGYLVTRLAPSALWLDGGWSVYRVSKETKAVYLGSYDTFAQVTDAMAVDNAARPPPLPVV